MVKREAPPSVPRDGLAAPVSPRPRPRASTSAAKKRCRYPIQIKKEEPASADEGPVVGVKVGPGDAESDASESFDDADVGQFLTLCHGLAPASPQADDATSDVVPRVGDEEVPVAEQLLPASSKAPPPPIKAAFPPPPPGQPPVELAAAASWPRLFAVGPRMAPEPPDRLACGQPSLGSVGLAVPGDSPLQDRSVLTVTCTTVADGSLLRLDQHSELYANVLKRIQERGRILAYFIDGNGWLWANMASEAQATRVFERHDGKRVQQDQVLVTLQQTRPCDWPPGVAPVGDRTVPPTPRNGGNRAGQWLEKGGIRHRGTGGSASGHHGSGSASEASSTTVAAPPLTPQQPRHPPPPPRPRASSASDVWSSSSWHESSSSSTSSWARDDRPPWRR